MKKKECPSCAMEIDRESKICPVCGYEFPDFHAGYKWISLILLIVILLFIIGRII